MTVVTYNHLPEFNGKLPKLHKVVYAKTVDNAMAMYQISYKDHLVDAWLVENCKHPYYHSPGYLEEKFIEFEDSKEAMWFALRWS